MNAWPHFSRVLRIAFVKGLLLFFGEISYAEVETRLGATETKSHSEVDLRLFDLFWKNVGDSFSGTSLLFHGAAFGSTYALIETGVDARVYDTFRHSENWAAWPGAVIGSGAAAHLAAAYLYIHGYRFKDSESFGGAFVIAQSTLITFTYVVLLKFTTGRANPNNRIGVQSQLQAEDFQFGFMENGMTAYGWPSGHVSHTVAVTSALTHYYPDRTWLKWLSLGLSTYMIYTVSAHDYGQMHWFSDGVAGAFIGYAIGSTVGKNWRDYIHGNKEPSVTPKTTFMPALGPHFVAAVVRHEF